MGFRNSIGLKPCTIFFIIVALFFTTRVFAGGTVYVEIYSCPSIVRADEAVDVTVRVKFSGDDDDGPWQVTDLDLRDDDGWPLYSSIKAVNDPFYIYSQNSWYYYTYEDVVLGDYDDGGNGIELCRPGAATGPKSLSRILLRGKLFKSTICLAELH